MIDLHGWHWIVINTSAGKDSQAMTDYVVNECNRQGVPLHRIWMLHCDLGLSPKGEPIEWPGTMELAQEHAAHYGLRFIVCKRQVRGFLEEVKKRGAWPDQKRRYCTSYFKRDQGKKVLTDLANRIRQYKGERVRILNCFGFRAQESSRRRKLPELSWNSKASSGIKEVWDWLPIHKMQETEVWETIKRSGVPYHHAYDLGMKRLSCRFCIFAPRGQLLISARNNPALFQEYLDLEREMGHSFKLNLPLADIEKLRDDGAEPESDDGCWNM